MLIEELKLKNFRNYSELTLHPHPGVNLYFGRNGSGKTNLLEAIHYCSLGRSHRISNDANAVKNGEAFALSSVSIRNSLGQREIAVRFHPDETQKKSILLDGKKIAKFSDMMGCLRCVIFSPEDLGLIKEGPSLRRRYLDMMISQINRGYFIALQQYRTCMDQRNALIRNLRANSYADTSMLSAFEETMAAPAAVIIRERRRIVSLLSECARETYQRVSDTDEVFRMAYHSSVKEETEIEEVLCRLFRENREDDIRMGFTSVGPHRDDLILTLNKNQMKQFASQGQIRTAALSMKLSQMQILRDQSGEEPVLLLDDVMSELDRKRRACLIGEISSFQTFITCADRDDVDCEKVDKMWMVSADAGEAKVEEIQNSEFRIQN
ncbi:DNA replication/repair protein RecF [Aristaeella hokkaidonensis]|uniref:DNA replication/repair protein RecF n=1 Tax=Aristaeella hokkaidonensis TaxID=3046382 RepID=A0AC61N2D0_9FIRM|nr:DNA replication/repair protein RecF [Aristaeella hokkaidonensis]QUC66645.1 DNA replication/repair protein RecF [Aristaeella hokkaidonensis]